MTPTPTISSDPQPSTSMPHACGTVDVWRASLAHTDTLEGLAWCLDSTEERRASRFRTARDRCRFRAARSLLRHILSGYVDTPPEKLGFRYGPQGKPFLAAQPDVHFNLSHTGDVLVVAVARGRRLGVDVETIIPETVMSEVMDTVSSDPERALLALLPASVRSERFSQLWTRKEAYIKADGRGMSLDLKRVDVLSHPHRIRTRGEAALLWTPCPEWTVRDVEAGPGLAAALAVEGDGWRTAQLEWPADGA